MKKLSAICFIIVIALSGCGVSTRVNSLKDPSYEGHQFRKVLVTAAFKSLEWQETVENDMVSFLHSHGVAAECSYRVLPPLRSYSDSEKVAIYKKYGFDCYLAVTGTGVNKVDLHVPSYTYADVNVQGTRTGAYGYGSSTTSDAYTQTVASSMDVTFDLRDFQKGQTVCRCESNTELRYNDGWSWGKDAQASVSMASQSMCSSVGSELLKNDLFFRN